MYASHIVLVGTSVVRNAAARTGDARLVACARARPGSGEDEACDPRRDPRLLDPVLEALSGDPAGVSAEINAMRPWLEAAQAGAPGYLDRVVLVATDTGVGRLAAEALRRALEGVAGGVEVVVVEGLGREERFAVTLRRLHRRLVELVRGEKRAGACVLSNLTGGFKPESGVGLLASISGGGDLAYYIHESFRRTVVIPLAPYVNPRLVEEILVGAKPGGEGYLLGDPQDEARCLAWLTQPLGLARLDEDSVVLTADLLELLRGLHAH